LKSKEKIIYLESLRGIACVLVVIYHYKICDFFYLPETVWICMEFFFVLSGFVIALNYQERILDFKSFISFKKKRFLRLYPLHLLTLLLMAFFYFKTTNEFNFYNFLINLLFLQNLILDNLTFNGPSWSVSSEFYVYIVFGITSLILQNKKKKFLFISSLFIIASFVYLIIQDSFETQFGFARVIYSFFLGVMIYNITQYENIKIPNYVSYFSIFLIIFCIIYFEMIDENINFNIFMPILFFVYITSLVCGEKSKMKEFLNNRMLVSLGTWSYGIYLLHIPVSYYGSIFLKNINFYENTNIKLSTLNDLTAVFFLLMTIFISKYSYVYFEKKFQTLKF
jgi:peptidoglycan/LPS O-acetylase OafA/YrhL